MKSFRVRSVNGNIAVSKTAVRGSTPSRARQIKHLMMVIPQLSVTDDVIGFIRGGWVAPRSYV